MTFSKKWSAPFIVFVIAGTVIPILSIAYYGFTARGGGITLDNVTAMFSANHMQALGLSLLLALVSTLVCLIVAFPMAIVLRDSKFGKQGFTIFVLILPMWMNFLLRTMAWQVLLERAGVINGILQALGLPRQEMMNTPGAVVLGMVYDFLPFMILPIYNAVMKIDSHLIEAAYDLGAGKAYVYRKVILPLCVPGIVSGVTMVFVPSLTTFAISNMLGGGVIVQRFGDLVRGRRSNTKRIEEGLVTPTLAATPGDLSLVLPKRILDGIIEMIYALDKIAPGTANDDTLLYGVEVKFYNMEVDIDENLESRYKGLYIIGDGSGVTHSLSHASASGVYVARKIAEKQ